MIVGSAITRDYRQDTPVICSVDNAHVRAPGLYLRTQQLLSACFVFFPTRPAPTTLKITSAKRPFFHISLTTHILLYFILIAIGIDYNSANFSRASQILIYISRGNFHQFQIFAGEFLGCVQARIKSPPLGYNGFWPLGNVLN